MPPDVQALAARAVQRDPAAAEQLAQRAVWKAAFPRGQRYFLTQHGILVDSDPPTMPRTAGAPLSVRLLWEDFGPALQRASLHCGVGLDTLVALAAKEAVSLPGGCHRDAACARREPGFTSEARTPHRLSSGLLQTLISTARSVAPWAGFTAAEITAARLHDPAVSAACGAAYVRRQWLQHRGDPVLIQAAYNAGGVYVSDKNVWRLRTYGEQRTEGFIAYFNDFHAWLLDAPLPGVALAADFLA